MHQKLVVGQAENIFFGSGCSRTHWGSSQRSCRPPSWIGEGPQDTGGGDRRKRKGGVAYIRERDGNGIEGEGRTNQ